LPEVLTERLLKGNNLQLNKDLDANPENLPKTSTELAKTTIQKFEKKLNMNLSLKKINKYPYGNLYKFDTNDASYWVNDNSGRVQSALWYEEGPRNKKEIISLDQGYAIAEAYAKEKYSELWNTTQKKGTKLVRKEINDMGTIRVQQFMWQEIFYNSDLNSVTNPEVSGLNSVSITISPYSGRIISYNERYQSLDTSLNLNPSLSQEQAWKYAESYFHAVGITNIQLKERKCFGLQIAPDNTNNQHLVWKFEVMQKDEHGFDVGGWVGIDAHDGDVIWHALVG
jgi:hypothetical protein